MPRILRLPNRGRLLIATDLQGNLGDFQKLMGHFRAAGPDTFLVLTGDLVHGPDEETVRDWPSYLGTPYLDESPALIEALIEAQQEAPGRIWCLLGNHDHAHIGGPTTPKFYADERGALETRLGPEGTSRLRTLVEGFPLVAVAPCGAVLTHAAPAAPLKSPEDLENLQLTGYSDWNFRDFLSVPLLGPLLWARSASAAAAAQFLRVLGGTISLYGHDVIREGYSFESEHQCCFSTSFGLYDERKVYVELDLGASYPTVRTLREGIEIRPLG